MDQINDLLESSSWKVYQKYILEVRPALFRFLIIFVGGLILGTVFFDKFVNLIFRVFNFHGVNIVLTSPYQFFGLALSMGLFIGIILSGPYLIYEIIKFSKPAMTSQEYFLLKKILPFSLIFFIFGFFFGAYMIQFVINLYQGVTFSLNVSNIWPIDHLLTQILLGGVMMGLAFELPLILTFLIRLKIIKTTDLASKRRYAYVAVLILAIILPFTADAISFIVVIIPLLFLFELTLLLNRNYI